MTDKLPKPLSKPVRIYIESFSCCSFLASEFQVPRNEIEKFLRRRVLTVISSTSFLVLIRETFESGVSRQLYLVALR